jgi:hypothetical protein
MVLACQPPAEAETLVIAGFLCPACIRKTRALLRANLYAAIDFKSPQGFQFFILNLDTYTECATSTYR